MRTNRFRWLAAAGCAAILSAVLLASAPRGLGAQTGKKKPDPDITRYTKQLMARFAAWDRNDDNVLDKTELARAFRGASARPYDYRPAAKEPPARRRARVLYAGLLAAPRSVLPVPLLEAGIVEVCAPAAPPAPVAKPYTTFPDYQFLVVAGTGGQSKLTRKQFETWVRSYARQVDTYEEAKQHVAAAKKKFAGAKAAKTKKAAQVELERSTGDFQRAAAQLNAIPAPIHQTLNIWKR
ncbi:MAG: hypothetical protein IT429_10130 [Gemmataceae bacterium]|nr:hypothetical protein [Gemmataceae bacterium]